jgi:Zn-dependent peptidase ImmA (M78 family)
MDKIANPDMLLLARESRGLSQKELAARLQVSQAAISKAEKLSGKVSDKLLAAIADELRYPAAFFFQTGGRYEPLTILHRKQASLPQSIRHRVEANANVTLLHIHHLLDSVELPECGVPSHSAEDFTDGIEGVARAVRTTLRLPGGPIASMSGVLEKMGVILVARDFGSEKLDAFSMRTSECPVVFFNRTMPWCRIRFSLAHELGHMVLDHLPGQNGIEEEAHAFASAFLMPREDMLRVFNEEKLDMRFFANLKPRWKVSMQALMRRASDLGVLERPAYEYLCRLMGTSGFRKREPAVLDIAPEEPKLLRRIIMLHLDDMGYSKDELCEAICADPASFDALYPDFVQKRPKTPILRCIK